MSNKSNRWLRPVLWALIALLIGAVFWWTDTAKAGPPPLRPAHERATLVLVEKAARKLTLFKHDRVLASYKIALGFSPKGDKFREGDGRTPEGRYEIDRRNPQSSFHLSLRINYPRADQRAAAIAAGRNPGGDIFIHGQPNGYRGPGLKRDWTSGCAAVTDAEIREIWSLVAIGTPVEIRP
ncbi:MAG: L,D-transpeptidase family protein [Pseudomonadota bacterium]